MTPLARDLVCAPGILASQPDLFFLSSALSLTGFGDQLPSPNLPVTVFAPTNNAILGLLNGLSTSPAFPISSTSSATRLHMWSRSWVSL